MLSSVLSAAVKYGYLQSNPVPSADLPPRSIRRLPQLPSAEQLQRLISRLDEPYRTMLWLACVTGLRPSELMALRWSAVDFERKCLWVLEAVNHGDFHTPKYHRKNRPIRLAEADLERLARFRQRAPEAQGNDWLFPNKRGTGPMEYSSVLLRQIQPKARELGLPPVTWRLLRQWHATVLHDANVPVKAAQERLGHSRADITLEHYVHHSQPAAEQAARVVSERLATKAILPDGVSQMLATPPDQGGYLLEKIGGAGGNRTHV